MTPSPTFGSGIILKAALFFCQKLLGQDNFSGRIKNRKASYTENHLGHFWHLFLCR